MNKRGIGISFETTVVAILVLVVLGVVVAIFISQSNKYADDYSKVTEQASEQIKGCNALFGRHCSPCDTNTEESISGRFEECVSDDNLNGICCEKKSS